MKSVMESERTRGQLKQVFLQIDSSASCEASLL